MSATLHLIFHLSLAWGYLKLLNLIFKVTLASITILRTSNSWTSFPMLKKKKKDALLYQIPVTSVRITPKCGTTSSRSCRVWVGRGWHVSLPLPFKSHWGGGHQQGSLCTHRLLHMAQACFQHQYLWERCEKDFALSPGEWAVRILLETKERIGSSAFFNPNSFRMTHWESFIQTWIYPRVFLAKPSHSLREPMQIILF